MHLTPEIVMKVLEYSPVTTRSGLRIFGSTAPYWLLDNKSKLALLPSFMYNLKVSPHLYDLDLSNLNDISANYMICPLSCLYITKMIPCNTLILNIDLINISPSTKAILTCMESEMLLYRKARVHCNMEALFRKKFHNILWIYDERQMMMFPYGFRGNIYIYITSYMRITYDSQSILQDVIRAFSEAVGLDLSYNLIDHRDNFYRGILVRGMQVVPIESSRMNPKSIFKYIVNDSLILTFDEVFIIDPKGRYSKASNVMLRNSSRDSLEATKLYMDSSRLSFLAPNVKFISSLRRHDETDTIRTANKLFNKCPSLEVLLLGSDCKDQCVLPENNFTKVKCGMKRHEFHRAHFVPLKNASEVTEL